MALVRRMKQGLLIGSLPLIVAPFLIAASIDGDGEGGADQSTRLTVTGIGWDSQPVPFLQMGAGAENFSVDASDAMADNAAKLAQIRRRLARAGVDERDIRTSGLTLSPSTSRDDGESVKGFQAHHMLDIILRQPDKAGVVLDALVDAGATDISGPRSYWEASPAAAARARTAAIKDAMTRADVYATALGMKVRRIVSITDSSGYATNQPQAAMAVDVAPGTRIDPGQSNVAVSIGAVFELSRS